jgi:hypothetical protein
MEASMFPTRLRQAVNAAAIAAVCAAPTMLAPASAVAEGKAPGAKPPIAKFKAARKKAATPKAAELKAAKPKAAKPKGGQTQTALGARPMTRLAKLVRSIDEHMQAGEEDGSLTKGEIARLASLKERVEIMDRMSRNDERLTDWERRYLETANKILQNIVRRERLDGQLSPAPKHVEMRIQRGLQDGTVTEQEAENLRGVQRRILAHRNAARESGDLTRKQKLRYLRAQHKLSTLLNHTRRYGPIKRALGQARFKATLERGVRNGSFSRREARVLWRTHQRIRGLRDRATADGRVTGTELTVLNRRLKAARHRLSFGERKAYRRTLRMRHRRRAGLGGGRPGGVSGDYGGAARRGAAAARAYGRSVGRGMGRLNRMYGGR